MHAYLLEYHPPQTQTQVMQQILEIALLSLPPSQYFQHPDLHHVQTQDSIGIDEIRALQQQLSSQPFALAAQLGIVWDANYLSLAAQNALLKLLEEPTACTQLFLVTQNPKQLISTIQSRCQLIAQLPQPRSLDQALLTELSALMTHSPIQRMGLLEPYTKDRAQTLIWLESLIQTLRWLLLASGNYSPEPTQNLPTIPTPQLLVLLKNCQIAYNDVSANVNIKLVLDQLALSWNQQQLDEMDT